MSNWRHVIVMIAALAVVACGQSSPPSESGASTDSSAADEAVESAAEALPEVAPGLLAAPSSAFTAFEPSEIGVFGAPSIRAALYPVVTTEAHEEGASLSLTIREEGDTATADVVRSGMADDSVSSGHLRLEFRREPDGWFPTNAYRRVQCARGELAGQWTTALCP